MSAQQIKKIRKLLKMTQEEFAQALGVSWSTVAKWESGDFNPSRLAAKAIERLQEERKGKI